MTNQVPRRNPILEEALLRQVQEYETIGGLPWPSARCACGREVFPAASEMHRSGEIRCSTCRAQRVLQRISVDA